jgi:hypothetical protein
MAILLPYSSLHVVEMTGTITRHGQVVDKNKRYPARKATSDPIFSARGKDYAESRLVRNSLALQHAGFRCKARGDRRSGP